MWKLKAFTKASHALPTIAVSLVISAFGWSLGWSGWSLFAVFITILIGQLSVGWSNDAFDSTLDARVGRTTKPTVTRDVSANSLWIAAFVALTIAIVLSWLVAFDVVNRHNRVVSTILDFSWRLTEPALRPIRSVIPNLGGIDISPIILILLLIFLRDVIYRLAFAAAT